MQHALVTWVCMEPVNREFRLTDTGNEDVSISLDDTCGMVAGLLCILVVGRIQWVGPFDSIPSLDFGVSRPVNSDNLCGSLVESVTNRKS